MADYPSNLRYTEDHEWALLDGNIVRVGITAYAVDQLGDITLVDLPAVGTKLEAKKRFGDIESVKTVSELFAPVSGEVVEVNAILQDKPEVVNADPYTQGWLLAIKPSNSAELEALLDAAKYTQHVAGLDH